MADSLVVFQNKFVTGVSPGGKPAEPGNRYTWHEALTYGWGFDAHTHGYSLRSNEADGFRYNKDALSGLHQRGDELVMSFLLVDVDNPGHTEWGSWDDAWQSLQVAFSLPGYLGDWACWYATRSGWRLVYKIADPYPVAEHERRYLGVIRDLDAAGVQGLDTSTKDWTRLFRLPHVVRDHKWLHDAPLYFNERAPLLNANAIEPADLIIPSMAGATEERFASRQMPGVQEYQHLVQDTFAKPTEWGRFARSSLSGTKWFPYIWEDRNFEEAIGTQELAYDGRDVALAALVGATIRRTGEREHGDATTPEHVYALLEGIAHSLTPDPAGEPWPAALWRKITRFWGTYQSEREERKELLAIQEAGHQTLRQQTAIAVQEWAEAAPMVHGNDIDQQAEWVSKHAIAITPKGEHHVMRPDGHYSSVGVHRELLTLAIRQNHSEALIPQEYIQVDAKGREVVKEVQEKHMVREHGTIVSGIDAIFFNQHGGRIRLADTDAARLEMGYYTRIGGEGRFDEEVDEWLRAMFGDYYEWMNNWIGCALAVDEGPVCALSLRGPANCGKGLFSRAMAECFSGQNWAGKSVFTTDFTEELIYSPFVVIDEGLDTGRSSAPSELFRSLVTGDPVEVTRKNKSNITNRVPMRVILTANNNTLVQSLVAPKGLSPEDRKAVMDRLTHLVLPEETGQFFEEKGGRAHTARKGEEWIYAGRGMPGRAARHFLWLYHQRKPERGRMMVRGIPSRVLYETLTSSAGNASIVHEALLDSIAAQSAGTTMDKGLYFAADGQHVLTTTRPILERIRNDDSYHAGRVTLAQVGQALANISTGKNHPAKERVCFFNQSGVFDLNQSESKMGRFWSISVDWLFEKAMEMGHMKAADRLDMIRVAIGHPSYKDQPL